MASTMSADHMHAHRGRRWGWRVALRSVLAVALLSAGCAVLAGTAHADGPVSTQVTRGNDTNRTNWYSDQPNLSPATVADPADFGQLFDAGLDGQIMAQPLVAGGVLVVATENNKVYGLDPNTGAPIWAQPATFGTPYDATALPDSNSGDIVGCSDLIPNIGITSTPVIDTVTRTIYVVAKEGLGSATQFKMHALDLDTGLEKANFPRVLEGTADNRALTFDATHQTQRPGLLLLNGVVYAAFSAHCQVANWSGWVMGVNATSGAITARWADHDGNSNATSGGGIWMSGGGLASDGNGQILFSIGNALTPNGGSYTKNNPPSEISNAVARLTVQGNGTLLMTDFFVPEDEDNLDLNDLDLGSGGLALLPSQFGASTSTPHLAVVAGKSGYVYLLNRDDLGGEQQGPGGGDLVIGKYGPNGGVWSQPSVWGGDGGYVYLPTASPGFESFGTAGSLTAYKYGVDGNGKPSLSLATSNNPNEVWGFGSSSVVVTSDGTTSGSALLWAIKSTEQGRGTGVPNAELVAYNAVPVNGQFVRVRSFSLGVTDTANKFTPPTIGPDGQVYAVNYNGHILGFGRTQVSGLTTSSVAFPDTAIGNSAAGTATFTATANTTITGLSTNGPFTFGTSNPVVGTPLTVGDHFTVPVTFTPTATGTISGSITATTASGTLAATLSGTGLAAGPQLTISPTTMNFGNVTVGASVSNAVTISNTGSTTATISSVTLPSGQFTVTGAPAVSSTIPAGGSVQAHAIFQPNAAGVANSTFTVVSDGGTVTLALSGTGATASHVAFSPVTEALDYGNVPVGSTGVMTFTLTNTGGSPATISVSKPPLTGPFHALTSLAEGSTIQPGDTLTERVSFTPTGTGPANATWQITANDGVGVHNVAFTGTGTSGAVTVPNVGGAGWSLNGAAVTTTGGVKLTTDGIPNRDTSGSTFYSTQLPTANLSVSFDAQLSGADPDTGADGLTLTFANPNSPTLLGGTGGGLGFAGITGVAVALDTFQNSANPSGNFVGISTHPVDGANNSLVWLATNITNQVPNLRAGTIHVAVTAVNGVLSVKINGTQVLSQAVSLPANALVGFTGGNGYFTDDHLVTNSVITVGAATTFQSIQTGQTLLAGQSLVAPGGQYRWAMQGDGNLVLYTATNGVLWASNTQGHAGAFLVNQGDGNLVLYSATGAPLWYSAKFTSAQTVVVMQDDGNVVQYAGSTPIWFTGTAVPPTPPANNILTGGQQLQPGQHIDSGNGYTFVIQGDGNAVVYFGSTAIWSSHTFTGGAVFVMQGDGNGVLYPPSGPVRFATGTNGNPGSVMVMQTDGNLVVYSAAGKALWASKAHP